jgi:hypothetical protein
VIAPTKKPVACDRLLLPGFYMRSKMAAMPWPPPMHMVTSA